jgi:hypothetical protein
LNLRPGNPTRNHEFRIEFKPGLQPEMLKSTPTGKSLIPVKPLEKKYSDLQK